MKPHIVWTQREWASVATWFRDHCIDPEARGFSNALREAQEAVLPSERHRSCVGLTHNVRRDAVLAMQNLAPPEPHKTAAPPTVQDLSTEDLLVELARRIARVITVAQQLCDSGTMVSKPVDRGFHPPAKHDPTPPREERTAKKKVLIVGPMGWQQQRLVQQFPLLDLRFCSVDNRPEDVYVKGVHCSEVILWTKFMTHAQQDQAKLSEVPKWYANGLEEIEARLRSLHG